MLVGDEFLLEGENELIVLVADEFVDEDVGIRIEFEIEIDLTFG